MNYLAIFEDEKGFTKTLEFANLPLIYKFVVCGKLKVIQQSTLSEYLPKQEIIEFHPYGERTEVHGKIIQRYKIC